MKNRIFQLCLASCALFLAPLLNAEGVNAKTQAKIDAWLATAKQLAAEPEIIKAVAAQNKQLPAEYAATTQEKWTALADADPLVRGFTKNAAGQALKAKKTDALIEAFVCDAQGLKVAFLSKPTNWSHKGKPKHDQPMTGEVWQGKLELDKSSGTMEIQIAVPVLDAGKPIGSLVVGIGLSALTSD